MRRHGRQAGGVETGFVSCIRDGDLFALGGDEAVAALKIRDKCKDSTLHFTVERLYCKRPILCLASSKY
jgi:hypothetical protein